MLLVSYLVIVFIVFELFWLKIIFLKIRNDFLRKLKKYKNIKSVK